MPHASTEDQLVEQPRMLSGLFTELGWPMVMEPSISRMTSIPLIWQPRYTLTSAMARGLMEIEAARACGLSAIYRHMTT